MTEEFNIQLNITSSRKDTNSSSDILDSIISQHKKPQGLSLNKSQENFGKNKLNPVRNAPSPSITRKKVKVVRELKRTVLPKKTGKSQKIPTADKIVIVNNESETKNVKPILKVSKKSVKNAFKGKNVSFGDNEILNKKEHDDASEYQPPSKKFKPSTLFANNPKIPKVECEDVTPLTASVFSKTSFTSLKLNKFMVSNLEKMNITKLTAVQKRAIPVIMKKKDLLVKSQTGSGKTMSYAIPIIEDLQSIEPKIKRSDGPYCIIVVPTRELVMQSYEVIMKLVNPFVWVVPGYLMGGENRKSEKARIRKGLNIVVSTPGRLVDHLDHTCTLELNKIKYLVIDEADRMLDLGFEKDVSRIITVMNKKCKSFQTILLSATLTPGVDKLAGMSLDDPVRIDMALTEKSEDGTDIAEDFATPSSLQHHFVIVPSKLRLVTLASFLLSKCQLNSNPCKAIVFLSTQDAVEFHHSLFHSTFLSPEDNDEAVRDFELFKLHGDMDQKDRMKVFKEFHAAMSGILLCTDVASRGIDLPHIEWIIQYNTPGTPTDYIHRVGRTARIGTKGNALLFLGPTEVDYVKVLAKQKIAMNEIQMDSILKHLLLESQRGRLDLKHKGQLPTTLQDAAAFLQAQFEDNLSENKNMRSLARKAYQSFIRAYAHYPASLKDIFHVKKLHLGHVATSFALSETPSGVAKLVGKHQKRQKAVTKKFFSAKGRVAAPSRRPTDGPKERIRIPFGFDKTSLKQKNSACYGNFSEFDSGI